MYMGHPPPPSQGRRKVCKYGGSISRTMYFELGGVYLHSGQNLGEGPNAPSPLANLVPTALPSCHHRRREGSWRRRPPGRIDHKKGQGDGYGNNKKTYLGIHSFCKNSIGVNQSRVHTQVLWEMDLLCFSFEQNNYFRGNIYRNYENG